MGLVRVSSSYYYNLVPFLGPEQPIMGYNHRVWMDPASPPRIEDMAHYIRKYVLSSQWDLIFSEAPPWGAKLPGERLNNCMRKARK